MKLYSDSFSKFDINRKNIIILIVLTIIVRFWGIHYGLPSVYNSTEYFIAKHALSFGARGSIEPLYFIYPTLYSYIVAVFFTIFFIFGKLFGLFNNSIDFAVEFLTEPTNFYLFGRSINAIAIIIAIVLFYKANKKLVSTNISFYLSILLLFSYNIHFFTFWMVPDAFLLLGTVVVLYFLIKQQSNILSLFELSFASLVCGLTISTKYNAGFLLLGWVGAIIQNRRQIRIKRIKYFIFGISFALFGFLLGSPYWIIKFKKFFEGFHTIWSQAYYSYNLETGLPYLWQFTALLKSEWLLGLVLILSIFLLIIRLRKKYLPYFLIVIPTILVVGSWEKQGLDYLLIIIPTLLVVIALWMNEIIIKVPKSEKIFLIVLILAFTVNFPRIIYANYLRTCQDTRKITSEWIKKNIVSTTKICYDHYHYDLDLIDISRFTISGAGNKYLSNDIKEKLITFQKKSNNYRFISPRKKIDISTLYNGFLPEKKISPYLLEQYTNPYKSFDEIKNEEVELLILNSATYLKYINNPIPAKDNPLREIFLNRKCFYLTTFDSLQPVIEIKPKFNRPGPIIKIYKLKE